MLSRILVPLALAITIIPPVSAQDPGLRDSIEMYSEDLGSLRRFYSLPSETDRARFTALDREWVGQLDNMSFTELSADAQIDWLLFKNLLSFREKERVHETKRNEEIEPWLPFASAIIELEEKRRLMEPLEARQAAASLSSILESIETLQSGLGEESGITPVLANRLVTAIDQLRRALGNWNRFYEGYDPSYTWWASKPYDDVSSALSAYSKSIQDKFAGEDSTIVGDPIGREALIDALENEMIPYTPEELVEIAEIEYAWCERELKRASKELGFGDDWPKALEHVKNLYVDPGKQPQLIRDLAIEAIDFVETHDLVTVPEVCKETWRMEMMTAERQKVNPYFTGGEVISVSYPTHEMDHAEKLMSLRGNNEHFCRATVHHELIPGHHLQLYMAKRYRPYRSAFRTPFFIEGWALYWEMLLWDMNFQRSAEDRMGMLFWRTHRCARIIFSLSFHLGTMSAQEAIDYLVEGVGHERRNATAEVRRSVIGSYEPLYQAAYMLGGLQIKSLRKEVVDTGRMTEKEFHDALLKENYIPVEMIRARFLDQELTPDFETNWRFYESLRP